MPHAPRTAGFVAVCAALAVGAALALGACGNGHAQPSDIATWSEPRGIAPELVYITEIDGFDLAVQSVGVSGEDGMFAAYLNAGGGMVALTTGREADPSAPPCAELPDSAKAPLRCGVERGDVHVGLEGEDVDPATLRKAAEAVRVPREDELSHLFASSREVEEAPPVERGDLPEHGDGAPVDPIGPGG